LEVKITVIEHQEALQLPGTICLTGYLLGIYLKKLTES